MKKFTWAILGVVLALTACKDLQEELVMRVGKLSLTATTEQSAGTRTLVAGAGEVFWEKGDEIKVFAGTASGRFVSDLDGPASTTEFTGSLGGAWTEGSPLWAVYPFSDEAALGGETLTAELPAVQTARGMSFAQGMNLSVARTTTASLQFYNVGGGVCFTLKEDGIQKVVFEGLNGEILAGKVKLAFQEDRPVIQEVFDGSTTVTLAAPEGKTLEADGVWYYIVALPGTLEKGFKLSFFKGNTVAQKTFSKTVTIKRSIYGEVRNADEGATYVPDTDENISFKDAKVKEIVVRYFDTSKNGELSYKEAAAVRSFLVDEALTRTDGEKVSVFAGTGIKSFDEIKYFTGLTKIEDGVFAGCTELTAVTIPANITEIGANAFKGCTGLQSITIEATTPPTIGEGAFSDTNDCPIIVPSGTTGIYTTAWGEYAPRIEGSQPDNEIWYTSTDGQIVLPNDTGVFGANLLSNEYNDRKGVLRFDGPVTMVGELAFLNCETLREAILPKTVTAIGGGAFYNNTGLERVHIPELVSEIGIQAFQRASFIERITVAPGNVTYDSRENCNAIIHTATNTLVAGCKNSSIPEGVKRIGDYAFVFCNGLTEITIPESVESIGMSAFNFCENLTSVSIPRSVVSLGDYAFNSCKSMTRATIYCEVPPSIGRSCFLNGSRYPIYVPAGSVDAYKTADGWSQYADRIQALAPETQPDNEIWYTSIDGQAVSPYAGNVFGANILSNEYRGGKGIIAFDGAVTEIGDFAFRSRSGLQTISIPGSVTKIGSGAFAGCSGMISFFVPARVTELGGSFFTQGVSLKSVSVSPENTVYDSRNDCNAIIETATNTLLLGCPSTVIPDNIRAIGSSAFSGYSDLTEIVIPNGVTSIKNDAFNSSGLVRITIPESVTSLGRRAIAHCHQLTQITLLPPIPPQGEADLFSDTNDCPIYVPTVSLGAYKGASYYSSYYNRYRPLDDSRPAPNEMWYTTQDGQVLDPYATDAFGVRILSNEYSGGKGVITFDGPLTKIGKNAFYYKFTMTGVCLPEVVTEICEYAFYGCGFGDLVLPDSVTLLADRSFAGITPLRQISIPKNVSEIGTLAFLDDSMLYGISVAVDNRVYDSRNNCNAIIHTATNTLIQGCAMTVIPEGVVAIGQKAFRKTAIRNLEIPEGVRVLGEEMCYGCRSLSSVTTPASVTALGDAAFSDCSALKEITMKAPTPPQAGLNLFAGSTCPIYVPAGSVEAYKTAEGWSQYADRIQALP